VRAGTYHFTMYVEYQDGRRDKVQASMYVTDEMKDQYVQAKRADLIESMYRRAYQPAEGGPFTCSDITEEFREHRAFEGG